MEAHEAGVVSSVSVLVNTPGWEDAASRARSVGSKLGVGLHLNLTAGRPLTNGDSLIERRTGNFHALPALVGRTLAGLIEPADVAAECAAQIARLRDARLAITHLDSHRHVHVLPRLWAPVVETARREGIRFVRVPLERLGSNAARGAALLKQAALLGAWRLASRGDAGPRHADRFCGISLQGGTRLLPRLLQLLDALEPGTTELMVHPGYADGDLGSWDDYIWEREAELRALTSPEVRARCRRGDFQLTHFGAL